MPAPPPTVACSLPSVPAQALVRRDSPASAAPPPTETHEDRGSRASARAKPSDATRPSRAACVSCRPPHVQNAASPAVAREAASCRRRRRLRFEFCPRRRQALRRACASRRRSAPSSCLAVRAVRGDGGLHRFVIERTLVLRTLRSECLQRRARCLLEARLLLKETQRPMSCARLRSSSVPRGAFTAQAFMTSWSAPSRCRLQALTNSSFSRRSLRVKLLAKRRATDRAAGTLPSSLVKHTARRSPIAVPSRAHREPLERPGPGPNRAGHTALDLRRPRVAQRPRGSRRAARAAVRGWCRGPAGAGTAQARGGVAHADPVSRYSAMRSSLCASPRKSERQAPLQGRRLVPARSAPSTSGPRDNVAMTRAETCK